METFNPRKKEAPDPDAKELLECANNLDLRGVCLVPPCNDEALTKAAGMVRKHLKILADLVKEIKDGGFKILILNEKFDEEKMTPGSISVMLLKKGETRDIYRQIFGAFFLQNSQNSCPDKENAQKTIAKLKDQINESLKQK